MLLDEITPDDDRAHEIASRERTFHEEAEQHVADLLADWPPLSAEQGTLVVRMFGPRPTLPPGLRVG